MVIYWIVTFLKYLGRDNQNSQIALGISVGMLLGLIPVFTLHWFLIAVLPFMIRMNLLAVFCSALCFSIFNLSLNSYFEQFGFWLLTGHPTLIPLFSKAYNYPLLPYTAFNHSTVMGSSVVALGVFLPLFFAAKLVAKNHRERIHTFWLSTRIQRAYAHTKRLIH